MKYFMRVVGVVVKNPANNIFEVVTTITNVLVTLGNEPMATS